MLDSIEKIVVEAKKHTYSNLRNMQLAMVPSILDTGYVVQKHITYKQDNYLIEDGRVVLKLSNFKYMTSMNPRLETSTLEEIPILDCIRDNIIFTTMLFINGIHIKLSDISLMKDINYTYLIFNSPVSMSHIEDVTLIYFPFKVSYFEYHVDLDNMIPIFEFNKEGILEKHGIMSYWTNDPKIGYFENTYLSSDIHNEILNIDPSIKLGRENIILFHKGLYISNNGMKVDSMNMISMDGTPGTTKMKVFYRTDLVAGEDLTDHFPNKELMSKIVNGVEKMPNMNLPLVMNPMDFKYSPNKPYEDNIDEAMFYLSTYNSKYLADVYERESTVKTYQYTGKHMKSIINIRTNRAVMPCLKYKEKETYVVVYKNGLLYERYSDIVYGVNEFSIPIDPEKTDDRDVFEIVYFTMVNNYCERIHIGSTHHKAVDMFNDGELLLYTNSPKEEMKYDIKLNNRSWYPVEFDINNGSVILKNTDYYNTELLFTTRNQFRYCYRNIEYDSVKIRLTPDFKGALNREQYLVYHNGRLLNRDFYRVILPATNNPYSDPYIYSRVKFNAGDKVEVLYLPLEMNEMDYAQDLTFEFASVVASYDNQGTFVIPYPFKLYNTPNKFIVLIGSTIISKDRYVIENDMIRFIDGTTLEYGKKITFVFSYEKSETQTSIKYVKEDDIINLEHNYISIDIDGQTEFQLDISYKTYLESNGTVMIFYRGLYIPEDMYQINKHTCKITFLPNTFTEGSYIDIVVCYSVDNVVKNYDATVIASENNQTTFNIPAVVLEAIMSGDKAIIMKHGTLLIEGIHFTVSQKLGTITFTNGFVKDDFFTIIVFSANNSIVRHYSTEFIVEEDNQRVFNLGNLYENFTNTKNKFLLYIGNILIDPDRYTIDTTVGNNIVFNEDMKLTKGRLIRLICLYLDTTTDFTYNEIGSARYNDTEAIDIPLVENQTVYTIPIEVAAYDENKFFLTAGSVYISSDDCQQNEINRDLFIRPRNRKTDKHESGTENS